MEKLSKTVTIDAHVEKVFAYLGDPLNLPEIWPSMIDTRNNRILENGHKAYDWTYKMAGIKFDGSSETIEEIENEKSVVITHGGIESKFIWTFIPKGPAMDLFLQIEYRVPVPLLGKLAEGFIVKQNQHEMDIMLANLKTRMEVHEPVHHA